MKIDRVELKRVKMTMREPFETSFGVELDKEFFLALVYSDGAFGIGECGAANDPFYLEETNASVYYVLKEFLIPRMLKFDFQSPWDAVEAFRQVRGNQMAKAMLDAALWDLFAKTEGTPLFRYIGGTKTEVAVGISVGIKPTIEALVEKVRGYVDAGYKRVKVKIKPGYDLVPLRALREVFPDLPLMADANSAYSLDDLDLLRHLDDFDLTMIEQPLNYDDVYQHSILAKEIATPICLDESIRSLGDLEEAYALGACSIVNLKMPRVGGISESLKIEKFCREHKMGLWCGGLLEAGVGRAFNVALTTLDGFNMPGDTAPSARYFEKDIINPEVVFSSAGTIAAWELPGVGCQIDNEALDKFIVASETFEAE